jgi:hypothetical protein
MLQLVLEVFKPRSIPRAQYFEVAAPLHVLFRHGSDCFSAAQLLRQKETEAALADDVSPAPCGINSGQMALAFN